MTEDPKEQRSAESQQYDRASPSGAEHHLTKSSEGQPRITNTQKEKDARRVAAGKRLGAISRVAKERKRERDRAKPSDAERQQHSDSTEEQEQSETSENYSKGSVMMVLAGVGLVAGLVYLFTRNQDQVKGERSVAERSDS